MTHEKHIFITGGTGLVGSNIIQDALLRDITVFTVTRGNHATQRTKEIIISAFYNRGFTQHQIDELLSKLHIFPIDWENPENYLSHIFQKLQNDKIKLNAVIHCASDMTYSRMNVFSAYNQNVIATSKLHSLFSNHCHSLLSDKARFYFYSTAYSCGINNNVNDEIIHMEANAPSVYHLTKSYIEKELWIKSQINDDNALPITIIRPSGIIGRSDNGDFGKHQVGLADVFSIFQNNIKGTQHINLDIEGNAEINFVPVNVISKWNLDIIETQEKVTNRYNVFHFTALKGIRKNELFSILSKLYNVNISYGAANTKMDLLFNKRLKKHKLYLENEWKFSRAQLNQHLGLNSENDNFDVIKTIEKTHQYFLKNSILSNCEVA